MATSPARRRMRPQSPDAAAAPSDLESLPPELLDEILSRLPLGDAVRTSALARAWRHRWESVPSLRFSWAFSDPNAISGVLRRYSCPVREFNHYCIDREEFCHCSRWLRLLALRGVQSLCLLFQRSDPVMLLQPSIFSCRELTTLDLRGCDIPAPPPGFTGLPKLTELRLINVGLPEGARVLELLIVAAPLLEILCLEFLSVHYNSGRYYHWVIQAPSLRILSINAIMDDEWEINDLPSLEEADIDCAVYTPDLDLVKLMRRLVHARKLKFAMPTRDGNILEGLSYPFVNMKSLSLRTSLHLLSSVSSVFFLLRNTPELEVLKFELNDDYSEDDEVDCDFLNAQWTDDLFSNLIHVDVMNMMCKLSEWYFIEFVLSKARRLQELQVCLDEFCQESNEEAITKLARYRRASPQAKVFFSGR